MTEAAREAMGDLGYDLDEILAQEEEPGLGNGGLGRLAACYMDSLASVEVPAVGYGIRYEFGIFDQAIRDGWQLEITDKWLKNGNPWEIARSEIAFEVKFGGHTEPATDEQGRFCVRWIPQTEVRGIAYDTPIAGYQVATCNTLRLWKAEAIESFDFAAFNESDYDRAVEDKVESETITKVLYPNDEAHRGKELRLKQQFFFSSCSLQDMLRIHTLLGGKPANFHEKWAVQLNDTHPAVAVAELMRLLLDEHALGLGRSVEGHARDVRLHQSYSAAGGAGEVDGRSLRHTAAAASRDRFRDQPSLPRRSARRHFPATKRVSRDFRSSMKPGRAPCGWRISPASAATKSMALPSSTPSSSSKLCCAISRSSGRRNSAT